MARVTIVKRAQQRYATKPVIDPATGEQKIVPVMSRSGQQKVTKRGKPVVKRVTENDKERPLPNRSCGKCGQEIKVGDPYKWVKPKSGPYGGTMRVRCIKCPSWRPSELTGSAALSALYGAQEAAEDEISNWDREDISGLESLLEDLASGIREAAEVYEESAQNMEDGFGHETYLSEELREKAQTLNDQADEVESAKDDLEEFDEDDARSEVEDEVFTEYLAEFDADTIGDATTYADAVTSVEGFDVEVYESRVEDAIATKKDEWADEQQGKAEDAMSNVEGP